MAELEKRCLLLSHVFIRPGEEYKKDVIDLVVRHFRKYNKNLYIIITGHGEAPHSATTDLCDMCHWDSKIIESEIGYGHPQLVSIGLQHAKKAGFQNICKFRSDGISLIENFSEYCEGILKQEKTKLMITQQTCLGRGLIGDLFMYGDLDFLIKCWTPENWDYSRDGCYNVGRNFARACGVEYASGDWKSALLTSASLRDVSTLKWVDFRAHWRELLAMKEAILENKLDCRPYLWGYKEGFAIYSTEKDFVKNG